MTGRTKVVHIGPNGNHLGLCGTYGFWLAEEEYEEYNGQLPHAWLGGPYVFCDVCVLLRLANKGMND